jgi:hypothetical protein
MDRPRSAREPAPEVQERYGIETVSAQIDDLFERVVAGLGAPGDGSVMQMDADKVVRGLHSGSVDVLRLLIVDEHQMVTEALAARLSAAPGLWIAGGATTSDPRLPEKVRWLRPDVIIIDVEPLGFAVGEFLQRLAAAWPAAHVVIVSSGCNIGQAVMAARFGAAAWGVQRPERRRPGNGCPGRVQRAVLVPTGNAR